MTHRSVDLIKARGYPAGRKRRVLGRPTPNHGGARQAAAYITAEVGDEGETAESR